MSAEFPDVLSFTLTNRCNLRCKMCGQWGVEGYLKDRPRPPADLPAAVWNRLTDEAADHGREWIGIRGGEPFLHPDILDVLRHMKARQLRVSMDTNGTLLGQFAPAIAEIGLDQLNISVDGPERIHDDVRGVPGGFARIAQGLAAVDAACAARHAASPSRCLVFTISPWSYRGLSEMPAVSRSLGITNLALVPYYWFDQVTGEAYEAAMKQDLDCRAWSWRGFHNETSGVDWPELSRQLQQFRDNLGDLQLIPFMKYGDAHYREWFGNCTSKVGRCECRTPWRLLDIQPNGDANFCVDFPDYVVGNVSQETIEQIWNGPRAERFRSRREQAPLPICNRCGAKYMAGGEPD